VLRGESGFAFLRDRLLWTELIRNVGRGKHFKHPSRTQHANDGARPVCYTRVVLAGQAEPGLGADCGPGR